MVRHDLRDRSGHPLPGPESRKESGEKCTLCGQRQALTNDLDGPRDTLDRIRHRTRTFWQNEYLDPDKTGEERLCAICTTKRFLIEAGFDGEQQKLIGLTPVWAGPETPYKDLVEKRDRSGACLRVPFPSAALLAAQDFIQALGENKHQLRTQLNDVVEACGSANIPRTCFPRSLRSVRLNR